MIANDRETPFEIAVKMITAPSVGANLLRRRRL